MNIVVDANIVFSGILNVNGKIGDLLINSQNYFDFIAPGFLREEISKHYPRLCKVAGKTMEQIREMEFQICKHLTFISEEQIDESVWFAAEELVADIDPKDAHYVACSKQYNCKIWSGDKRLIDGLAKKGFSSFISLDELFLFRM